MECAKKINAKVALGRIPEVALGASDWLPPPNRILVLRGGSSAYSHTDYPAGALATVTEKRFEKRKIMYTRMYVPPPCHPVPGSSVSTTAVTSRSIRRD